MTTIALPAASVPAVRPGDVDNRGAYISFGLAYVLGHGANALSQGAHPLLALPSWLPITLLGAGFAAGTYYAARGAARAQRGADQPGLLAGKLLGLSWLSAFVALYLAITGLSAVIDAPDLQTLLWPAGSGLVVGLLYLGEGVARRNLVHYCLGTWIALVSTMGLFLGTPGLFWMLTIAGGSGYAVAAVFERRRLTTTR